jgi:hypothetical protein
MSQAASRLIPAMFKARRADAQRLDIEQDTPEELGMNFNTPRRCAFRKHRDGTPISQSRTRPRIWKKRGYPPLFEDDPKTIPLLEPDADWTEHQVIMNSRTLEALSAAARLAAESMDKARRGGLVEGK